LNLLKKPSPELTVSVWHKFIKPPYGGGNQFMLALRKALRQQGVLAVQNRLHSGINVYLLNSIHFDIDLFLKLKSKGQLHVVHRIDGPILLVRGSDREKDELCYDLNEQLASVTVLQSAWTYQRIVEMGYQPVNPVMIHNAANSHILQPNGYVSFDPTKEIRLISTSCSKTPRKGGPIYKWIEDHLDWKTSPWLQQNLDKRLGRFWRSP